jgi:hypothetical protein
MTKKKEVITYKSVIDKSLILKEGQTIEGIYKGKHKVEKFKKRFLRKPLDVSYSYILIETQSGTVEKIPETTGLTFIFDRGLVKEGEYLRITRDGDTPLKGGKTRKNFTVERKEKNEK